MPTRVGGWFIGGAVLLFGLAVATGTVVRYRDMGRGLIVVLCTAMFLVGWAAAAAWRRRHREQAADRPPAGTRWLGVLGLGAAALAWSIVIGGMCLPPRTPRGALWSLSASAASCLLAFVSAIVGISDPRGSGKSWSLTALVACAALVIFVIARMVWG